MSSIYENVLRLRDGRRLAIAEYGDRVGLPVIMLHGSPGSRLMFRTADLTARSLGLRLICPDRPGIGRSSPQPDRTLMSFAGDIQQMADHLALDRPVIFGVSGGGPYAVAASALLGARARLLALVSPVGPLSELKGVVHMHPGHRAFFFGLGRRPWLARALTAVSVRLFRANPIAFHRNFARMLGEPDRSILLAPGLPEHVTSDVAEALRQGPAGLLRDLELFAGDWNVEWSRIEAPVLLWQGTADVIVPAAAAFALGSRLQHVKLHTLEGAGHFWIYANIPAVLAEVAEAAASHPS